ncbi:MAG TPA: IS3 family transposase [Propionibacteriaceae bacterium]
MIIDYIERHKNVFGVEPICTTLTSADTPIAPSTISAARTRPPSARAVRDEDLKPVIVRVHQENYGVYGIRKMHAQLNREQVLTSCQPVARCTTQRLMKDLGLRGISRAKDPRTTVPGTAPDTRPDLVGRAFTADRPDRLWVADITYVRTFAGWVYCAFVLDVFSRRVVGWQVSTSLRTDLALDALNMGLWTRQHDGHDTHALVHHSDRGVQGEFNWSSQHLDHGGVRWELARRRDWPLLGAGGGSGHRIGHCGRRCAHRAGRSRLGRCSGTSGGGLRRV